MKFKKLLEPGKIGTLDVKNRVVMAPFETHYASRDGSVTQRMLNYYKERAKGGTGLIIVECTYIDTKASWASWCQLGAYDDGCIPSLATLAETIQDYGAKACLQIYHCGARRYLGTYPMVSPSRVQLVKPGVVPTELKIEEIGEIVDAFGAAAHRVKQAGFDMIEVHSGHGYLLANFLSPHTNRRVDLYGGDLKNRMRFPLEVLETIKAKVGENFPLGVRISATEFMDDGIRLDESKEFSKALEKIGVDVIHVSAGSHDTVDMQTEPLYYPLGAKAHLAKAIREVVDVPVIASGSITTPELAEKLLRKGYADFVSMARPLMADPYFVEKVAENRPEDICPCIRCCDGCSGRASDLIRPASCSVNATLGKEDERKIEKARETKKVVIVGGGPAGMEAARVAALRGHKVTLFEKRRFLGGLLVEASIPEFKQDLARLNKYLQSQLKKLNVKIIKGKKVTLQTFERLKFDALIVATGSTLAKLPIRCSGNTEVFTPIDILRAETGGKVVGENVMIIGGGLMNCETALFLAKQGKNVKIVTRRHEIAEDADTIFKKAINREFQKYGVSVSLGLLTEEITDCSVVVTDIHGAKRVFEADAIVMGMMKPDNELAQKLDGKKIRYIQVGDCVKPRRIYDAIHDGYLAALKI